MEKLLCDFTVKMTRDNGDGIIFQSSDWKTELIVSGINNALSGTAIFEYNNLLSQHKNASYKKQSVNWYIVSWIEGDYIVDTFIDPGFDSGH